MEEVQKLTKSQLIQKMEALKEAYEGELLLRSARIESAEGCLMRYEARASAGIVSQFKDAFTHSLTAAVLGLLLGFVVPFGIWYLVHYELTETVWKVQLLFVLGGLAFSAKTVYQWTKEAFDCKYKAFGFVLLMEGIMTFSETSWLSIVSLSYLAVINSVASASILARNNMREKWR